MADLTIYFIYALILDDAGGSLASKSGNYGGRLGSGPRAETSLAEADE